jgi:hypothetical protein
MRVAPSWRYWCANHDTRPSPWAGEDFALAANQGCPLAHADQTQSGANLFGFDVEADTVIGDFQTQISIPANDSHQHAGSAAMLDRIVNSLLNNPEEGERYGTIQVFFHSLAVTPDGDTQALGAFLAVALHRCGQAQVFERRRV